MLDYKGILNLYRKDVKTDDELRAKVTPFMEFLSYLDTAREMLVNATTAARAIPDEFGLKELKDKVEEITDFLDEYSGDSVIEDMNESNSN